MLVKPVHPLNADSPIDVTLFDIVTLVKPVQPSNAQSPIESPLVIITIFRLLISLICGMAIEGIDTSLIGHPKNAESPIDVTLFGIVTLVKPVHPLNTPLPISVTLSGITTLVKPVHP